MQYSKLMMVPENIGCSIETFLTFAGAKYY